VVVVVVVVVVMLLLLVVVVVVVLGHVLGLGLLVLDRCCTTRTRIACSFPVSCLSCFAQHRMPFHLSFILSLFCFAFFLPCRPTS
jgi:hypothetical protein